MVIKKTILASVLIAGIAGSSVRAVGLPDIQNNLPEQKTLANFFVALTAVKALTTLATALRKKQKPSLSNMLPVVASCDKGEDGNTVKRLLDTEVCFGVNANVSHVVAAAAATYAVPAALKLLADRTK